MFSRFRITALVSGAVLLAAMAAIAAGCGSTTASNGTIGISPDCQAAPTVIPQSQGRPMMVEFFRPT